jgi:hypothetical protein
MAQISIMEGAASLSETFLLKIVRTTRLTRRCAAEKWVMRDDDPPKLHESRCRAGRERGEHGRLDRERDW